MTPRALGQIFQNLRQISRFKMEFSFCDTFYGKPIFYPQESLLGVAPAHYLVKRKTCLSVSNYGTLSVIFIVVSYDVFQAP